MSPLGARVAAGLLVAFAVAARSLDWALVFPGDGSVWLDPFDGAYRFRRALFTLAHFPALLRFDPYLGFPSGAPVPAPPLYDWLLGASAHLLGGGIGTLERVAAWVAPVLGGLCVLPIAAAGRCVAGAGVGLAAAALYACLPVAINFARVGDADHHAAVALLGALLLAQTLALARGATAARELALWTGIALTRAALVLTWSGSLLYVAVADSVLLGLGLLAGSGWLARHALGLAAGAVLLAPLAAAEHAAGTAAFTSTTFSWLHVAVLAALADFAATLALAERLRPSRGPAGRALRAAALALLALGALAALPPLRALSSPVAAFLTRTDTWGHANLEQRPLFPWLTRTPLVHGRPATALYGGFAFLLPLAPLAALAAARDPRRRRPALALAGWSAPLAVLAIAQVRFGNDFAPAGSICMALGLAGCRDALARRLPARLADALVLAGAAALLWPAVAAVHRPALERAVSLARHPSLALAVTRRSGSGSLHRFAESVRRATPDGVAERDPFARPAFGILAPPNFGYALLSFARRATPASNAGPYLDPDLYASVLAFYDAEREPPAVAIARRLRARYVLTADHEALEPPSLAFRLQREGGSATADRSHLARFRLVTEGPEDGRALFYQFRGPPPRDAPAYRLFEVVQGAVLQVPASPGSTVEAELSLASPFGRPLAWRARARAGADGWARLRVPNPTFASAPVHALGPYRVAADGRAIHASVSEEQVRTGAVVVVLAPDTAGPAPATHETAPPL